ncbi:Exocyst complex component 7 [Nowakowskiella sp. JEL0407]|nr:Exocyst complex component 7 [Nowakowskiella sp. JEL0407]
MTRTELDLKLDQDIEELEQLQTSLNKTNTLTDDMVGMLTSFGLRLTKLKSSILPIYKSTQKLTCLHDNISKTLGHIGTVISYYDLASKEESLINRGPSENDLAPYLASVERLREALTNLNQTKYKSSEKAIAHLVDVLRRAVSRLNELFRKYLLQYQSTETTNDLMIISNSKRRKLSVAAHCNNSVVATELELGGHLQFIDTYVEIRSAYMQKSLEQAIISIGSEPKGNIKSGGAIGKVNSSFVEYTRQIMTTLKMERELLGKLLPKQVTQSTFQRVISSTLESYLESGESLVSRAQRGIQKKDYADVIVLINVYESCSGMLKEFDGVVSFVRIFILRRKNDAAKQSSLPVDGTVHELTSTTVNTIKRLQDYINPLDAILSEAMISTPSYSSYISSTIGHLSSNIEQKAKQYKKPTLSIIFMLNNLNYIVKNIGAGKVKGLEDGVLGRLEKGVTERKILYLDTWKPTLEFLMDTTYVQSGALQKSLTKPQREVIKDKFKGFNESIDDLLKVQKNYAIPDPELKADLIRGIKAMLMPMYSRFYDRYQQIEFSKTPSKYIKFDKASLESTLELFFVQ